MAAIETSAPAGRLIYRHSLLVRLTHWVNAVSIFVLLMSGMAIFNAHPALYLGQQSDFAHPLLNLGVSAGDAVVVSEPFPGWLTGFARDLATGRLWHFLFAWILVVNGGLYLVTTIVSRHLDRDLVPKRSQLRDIGTTLRHHLRLYFPHERDYNVLQKFVYLAMIFIVLPLIVLAGLAMSPGVDSIAHWYPDLFGGRQTARTIHFVCATLIVVFIVVHVALVALSGPWNNIRSMITGRYRVDPEENSDVR